MATTQASCSNQTDEDYIDMEVSSSSSSSAFFCYSISSPPQTREFEFQMSTVSHDRELTTSPADILFYKGKLLPLHLPPRLQMVQNILRTSNTKPEEEEGFEVAYRIPSFNNGSTTPSSTNTSTPLESCNISPSESCRVSCELNPDDEYLSEWATEMSVFIGDHRPKKLSWSTKLKQIKQSSLGQKIKQSRTYLKSLFSKSGCNSDGSCTKTACNADDSQSISRRKNSINKYSNMNPFERINNGRYQISTTLMKSIENEMAADNHHHHQYQQEGLHSQRRSFSGVIPRQYSGTKSSCSSSTTSTSSSGYSSSSSSFSFSSNGSCYDSQLLKRSSSASSEIESSIEGAIAHCKQSNQTVVGSTKIVNGGNQSGVCSILSASRIGGVCGDQDRPGLCRI